MEKEKSKGKLLQWHPAFYAGIQIEFAKEAHKLIFEREHNLGTKPMQIDVLVIKKNPADTIQKNIGRIFRKHNIVEYKSPEDYLSIDDFYKVYGYTCFYKALASTEDEIKASEMTITFVCNRYPKKLVAHLKSERMLKVERQEQGIYYLLGDMFPMQLILTSKLSEETNLWLKNLTNDLRDNSSVEKLVREYSRHEDEELYKSIMNLIIQANQEKFQEARGMCEALRELFRDELEEREKIVRSESINQGIQSMIEVCKGLGCSREFVFDTILEKFHTSEEEAAEYMERYW